MLLPNLTHQAALLDLNRTTSLAPATLSRPPKTDKESIPDMPYVTKQVSSIPTRQFYTHASTN